MPVYNICVYFNKADMDRFMGSESKKAILDKTRQFFKRRIAEIPKKNL